MGSLYRKQYTIALPSDAEIVTRDGKRFAKWKPKKGRTKTAPLTTGKDGSQRVLVKAGTYTCKYRDGRNRVVEKPTGCRDEGAARAVLADLERRAQLIRSGVMTAREDEIAEQGSVPLETHVEEYVAYLKAKGSSASHVRDHERNLESIAKGCGFKLLADLDRSALERWLFAQSMSARSMNAHRAAALAFANWCVRSKRLLNNPFEGIPRANERADRRHTRRALTVEELEALLASALTRPLDKRSKMNRGKRKGKPGAKLKPKTEAKLKRLGWEHALIYKTLFLTGLRRGELASLTVGQLQFDVPCPYAELEAADEKNREGSQIPLRGDLVADMKAWLLDKLECLQDEARTQRRPVPVHLPLDTPLFRVPRELVKIFDADLEAAGIPKKDERGRVADVHSLRHSFGTHLSKGGVPLRTAQEAMRHSDPKLTANVYTDPQLLDVSGALNVLPLLPLSPSSEETRQSAVGSVSSAEGSSLAPNLAPTAGVSSQSEAVRQSLAMWKRKRNSNATKSVRSTPDKKKTPLTTLINGAFLVTLRGF